MATSCVWEAAAAGRRSIDGDEETKVDKRKENRVWAWIFFKNQLEHPQEFLK